MYFMVKDKGHNTICEIGVYSEKDPYTNDTYWTNKMYVSFNIKIYSEYLITNFNRADEIKEAFTKIQSFVLDLNESVTGDYPEVKQYYLEDPELSESKSQIIKVTRDRLYEIVNELGDTGIYVNED